MNPWEEDLTVVETQKVEPWKEDLIVDIPRGANVAGAARNLLQATPFLGTYADEAEGLARSLIRNEDFEKWRKNAEESALGNIENTNYGRALNIGANIAENAVLTGLTGGATLLPPVSAVQGAIEGFGRGSDLGERTTQAMVGGSLGFAIPTALNRILPTKTTQKALVDELAKSKDATKNIIGKALQKDTTPEDVIAQEVPKGMRKDLWANLRRGYTGKDAFRTPVLESSSAVASKPYSQYITEEIATVSPKYASKIGKEIEKMKLDELGEDIVGEFDPRQYVMDAVNKVMRSAPAEEQTAVAQALENAIAKRGVAKTLTSVAIERPISSSSGSFWNIGRRLAAPLTNMFNLGTLRGVSVGTENYVPKNLSDRLLNFYTPNVIRGATDALLEDYERRTLK